MKSISLEYSTDVCSAFLMLKALFDGNKQKIENERAPNKIQRDSIMACRRPLSLKASPKHCCNDNCHDHHDDDENGTTNHHVDAFL